MLKVNRDDKRPLWQQLLNQAIDHITNGVWKPGQLLTPTRELAQQLGAQTLLTKGDIVTVEDPRYPVAWMTMKYRKMKVTPVPVDEHGLVIEKVPADAKLILVTPAHQCAVGVMLSEPRRQQLLHRAAQQRAWIVEDDDDSEFRYRRSDAHII